MKCLIDAQLPRKMKLWFSLAGIDAIHTLDLPQANRTPDDELRRLVDQDDRVLVTKDADFVDSHVLRKSPTKLLLISTGNISNRQLEELLTPLIPRLLEEFNLSNFLELDPWGLIVRDGS